MMNLDGRRGVVWRGQKAQERSQERKERAEAQQAARRAEAGRLLDQRARAARRYVAAHGTTKRQEVADALGISTRSLSRILPRALSSGYVVTVTGSTGGIAPGPVSVPSDLSREGIDNAEERCWAAA